MACLSRTLQDRRGLDWRGVILMGFYCGMRLNDAYNLRWSNVDLVAPIKIITYEPRKTGEEGTVVIHPLLEDYLLSLRTPDSDEDFVFPSLALRKNVSPLSKTFRKIMQRAHIAQSVLRKRNQFEAQCLFPLVSLASAFILVNPSQQQRLGRSQDAVDRPRDAKRLSEIHPS